MKKIIFTVMFLFSFSILFSQVKEEVQDVQVTQGESVNVGEKSQSLEEVDREMTPLLGKKQGAEGSVQRTKKTKKIWTTIKNIFFFLIVVLIIFLIFRILKKLSGGGLDSEDLIEVVSSRQLAGNRYLHIIKLGKEYMLVSSTDGGVQLIKQLTDKEQIDSIQIYKEENAAPDNKNFRDILTQTLNLRKKGPSNGLKMQESIKNLKNQSNRLKKM